MAIPLCISVTNQGPPAYSIVPGWHCWACDKVLQSLANVDIHAASKRHRMVDELLEGRRFDHPNKLANMIS